MNRPIFLYFGIDVSKAILDIAWQSESVWQKKEIPNELEAIRSWLKSLAAHSVLVFEPTGTYHDKLMHLAAEAHIDFILITTRKSYHYAQYQGHLQRTDQQAARTLAELAMAQALSPSQLPSEMKSQRKQLHMALKAFNKQAQMLRNQIHALEQYYKVNSIAMQALEKALEGINEQIERIKEELHDLSDEEEHALAKLMQSVIGIGPKSTQEMLLYLGDLNSFQSHKQVLKFVGVAPSGHRSGSSVYTKEHISKRGPASLRATLYMAARSARKHNLICKELYDKLRKKGKPHKLAMIAVVAKLLTQVFHVVKSGIPFDNQYYLKFR